MILTTDFKGIVEAYKMIADEYKTKSHEPPSFKIFLDNIQIPIVSLEESQEQKQEENKEQSEVSDV